MNFSIILLSILIVSVTCSSHGGKKCDPKTIDFNKAIVEIPDDSTYVKETVGKWWYMSRWYPGLSENITSELYDYVDFPSTKPGLWGIYWDSYYRDKMSDCCVQPWTSVEKQRPDGDWFWAGMKMIKLYNSPEFQIAVRCIGLKDGRCADFSIFFWSLCPNPRPQDIAKGEKILEDVCFPYQRRFVDGKHTMDCTKNENICGNTKKGRGKCASGITGEDQFLKQQKMCERREKESKRKCGMKDDDDDADDIKGRRACMRD